MFLREEVHKRSPTEHRPVHLVLPSPVSWVPEVHPTPGKQPLRKDLQELLSAQAGKRCSQEVRQASTSATQLQLPQKEGNVFLKT